MKPVLQALVLAERIYETTSGQKIIAGTFNCIKLRKQQPPEEATDAGGRQVYLVQGGTPGSPYAYISLTDVCDNTKLDLQFVSLTRNKVLFETGMMVNADNRLQTVEIIAALPRLVVPEPGTYAFEIVCEGEIIGSHRIVAMAEE